MIQRKNFHGKIRKKEIRNEDDEEEENKEEIEKEKEEKNEKNENITIKLNEMKNNQMMRRR